MEQKRAHIIISGLVQGVGFRMLTQQMADILDLKGWVRNTADGKVEAVFEGEKDKVESMIAWAKKGPPIAQIENVEINWEEYKGEFKDFETK